MRDSAGAQPRWVILGCGYVGTVVRALLPRHGVTATSRRGGRHISALDLDDATQLDQLAVLARGALVLHTVPPGDHTREVRIAAALRGALHVTYLSSTGVYGAGEGRLVTEAEPVRPMSSAGEARTLAELALNQELTAAGVRFCILRAAGIYGRDRSLKARAMSGLRIVGDGSSFVSRIHVDDLAALILAVAQARYVGVLHAADDDPAPSRVVAHELAAAFGVGPPVYISPEAVTSETRAMLLANRRIDASKAKRELGIVWRYPSFRAALAEELTSELDADRGMV